MNDIKKKIFFLRKKINKFNYEYYILNKSSVNDEIYDFYLKELTFLENKYSKLISKNSPTQKVGGGIEKNKFNKYIHKIPMLSLNNAFNFDDLYNFDKQIKKITNLNEIEYICELKIDGISISLIYEEYNLKKALTRGDGEYGEDVTNNVKQIKSIPLKISKDKLIVRGEIFLNISEFNLINKIKKQNNELLFSNPRNAVSGTLRQLDSLIVLKRNLNSFFYYCFNPLDFGINTQINVLKYLKELKFNIENNFYFCNNIQEVFNYIEKIKNIKNNLDFQIDGIVIKVNNLFLYEKIGYTSKSPKWAIAYKFSSIIKSTKLLDIFPTIGRTGKITYNAKLKPISINGTIIKAASLYNAEFIKKNDIRINDFVYLKKAGEIIPKIIGYLPEKRQKNSVRWKENKYCPVCNSYLKKNNNKIDQFCKNVFCFKKKIRLIEHFCSRDAMNILGINTKIIEKLFNLNILNNFSDLYKLKNYKNILINLENFGEKSFNNIILSINNSKNNSLEKLLFGFGIRYIGKKVSKVLAMNFYNLDNLKNICVNQLLLINNIGYKIINSIVNYFSDLNNIKEIENLKKLGLNQKFILYNNEKKIFFNNNKIKNNNFVISGILSKPRIYFENLINFYGGNIFNSISKKIDFLLLGNFYGNKFEKAKKLNIKIISEKEFYELLKEIKK